MTPLRQRLIEELALRGYSNRTEEACVHAVAGLAQHYQRAPDRLSDQEVLGHTSLSTTSGYLHVSREHLAKIGSPLDKLYTI